LAVHIAHSPESQTCSLNSSQSCLTILDTFRRTDFPARYSPIEEQESYQDMVQQVKSLATSHFDGLDERLKALDLYLRRARQIRLQKLTDEERAALADLEERRSNLQTELEVACGWLRTVDLVRSEDRDERASTIADISLALDEMDETVRKLVLRPVPPQTPEERKVMALLGNRREADLIELILDAGDDLDLTSLVAGLIGLYQGNQVNIKVQRIWTS